MRTIAVALLHYPILDRAGEIVTTAITNLDLHDIARSAHSFGISDYFVVHPVAAQRELAERVRAHWVGGSGARRIPERRPPMERLRIVETLDEVFSTPGWQEGAEMWTTSAAAEGADVLRYRDARAMLRRPGPPVLLVFGTGWGLAPSVHERASARLEPIRSPRTDGFNHLSVRAAAAISFDRLLAPESR